jgi:hypothetical protein
MSDQHSDQPHDVGRKESGSLGGDDILAMVISIALFAILYQLLKAFDLIDVVLTIVGNMIPIILAICGLFVLGMVFYALLDYPVLLILLILLILILLGILGYFFTKGVIGALFVGLGIMFLLGRPYWVGLVLEIAGAIILFHKNC